MDNKTKTLLILAALAVGGFLVYNKVKSKSSSKTDNPPPPNCPKCTATRCKTGSHPEQVGECGCECVPDAVRPTEPTYDVNKLLDVIRNVYVLNNYDFGSDIQAEVLNDLKKMSSDDFKLTSKFFADALAGVDTTQDVEDGMDAIFAKFPSLGKPFVVKSNQIKDAMTELSFSRTRPEGEDSSPVFLGMSEQTAKEVIAVGDTLATAAAIFLTGGVGVAVAACWGLAKKIFGLFRKRK